MLDEQKVTYTLIFLVSTVALLFVVQVLELLI